MTLLLFFGILLLGVAVGLVARSFAPPPGRVEETVSQIGRYGFGRRRSAAAAEGAAGGSARERLDRLASRLGGGVVRRSKTSSLEELRRHLISAGLYNVTAGRFLGYRLLCTIGLPLVWIWLSATIGINPILAVFGTIICVALGWILPLRIVRDKAGRRLQEIDYQLPELIDLLVVTVEAGLGFVGSLQMASARLGGVLGDELQLMLQEQTMGLATNEALTNLLARANTPSMRSFVRSITQGETLGVSIGQIMRDLSNEMRRRRRAAAEERAQKAPIKILFPLVFLIFPAMFVILLAPAMIQFLRAIKGG